MSSDASTFSCCICSDLSQTICVYCTKDTCGNHLCERCHRCSDCCDCELRLVEHKYVPNGHRKTISLLDDDIEKLTA